MSSVSVGEVDGAGIIGGIIGIGLFGAVVVAGAVVMGGVAVAAKGVSLAKQAADRRRREQEEQQRRILLNAAEALSGELSSQIGQLNDAERKRSLEAALKQTLTSCRSEIQRGNTSIEDAFRKIRLKLLDSKLEEEMAASLASDFESIASRVEENLLEGFRSEWEGVLSSAKKILSLPLDQRPRALRSLITEATAFIGQMGKVKGISLDHLSEDVFVIPFTSKISGTHEQGEVIKSAREDIADFAARSAYFDRDEAEFLKPLLEEAISCENAFRLGLIRDQVKKTYGSLKERKLLTELFKQELRELLPVMRRLKNAQSLIVRMEELLVARSINREDFSTVYRKAKAILTTQIESLIDDTVARKVENVLSEMGYTLILENKTEPHDSAAELRPGEFYHLESPYEGYRVRVRVDGGKVSTRLVRVVGSEEEAKSQNEYQRQKDEETGKKWCRDLEEIYGSLENEGIFIEQIHRKEPGEELLDVVVDEKLAPRTGTTSTSKPGLHERRRK